MMVIGNKHFELWENRLHTVHDSPVIGCWSTTELSRTSHGKYGTLEQAKAALQTLLATHMMSGPWSIRQESTADRVVLYKDTGPDIEIVIWIE